MVRGRYRTRHTRTVDTSTQTEIEIIGNATTPEKFVITEKGIPVVRLQRISISKKKHPEKEFSSSLDRVLNQDINITNSNLEHDDKENQKSSRIEESKTLKVPSSYSTFLKAIDKNQKANSTLMDVLEDGENNRKEVVNQKYRKRCNNVFVYKPGPKCSKVSESLLEDHRIPIMLGISSDEESKLSIIIENSSRDASRIEPEPMQTSVPIIRPDVPAVNELLEPPRNLETEVANDRPPQTTNNRGPAFDLSFFSEGIISNQEKSFTESPQVNMQTEHLPQATNNSGPGCGSIFSVGINSNQEKSLQEVVMESRTVNMETNLEKHNNNQNEERTKEKVNSKSSGAKFAKKFRLTFDDYKIISSKNEETQEENDGSELRKFLKIYTDTVHIHNHFYR